MRKWFKIYYYGGYPNQFEEFKTLPVDFDMKRLYALYRGMVAAADMQVGRLMEFLDVMRSQIGYEIPMGTDHWGHFGVNEAIKIARAAEPYNLAYIEDIIPWQYNEQWREITEASTTPTQTGEDIYMLYGGFHDLIEQHAVDIVHPDPNTAGGILETKKVKEGLRWKTFF